jgi:hypothetical protein
MVRDPRKAIDKDNASVRPFNTEGEWSNLRESIGACGLALAGDMPVYNAFYEMIGRNTRFRRSKELVRGVHYLARGMEGKRRPVSAVSRVSFFRAFDVTPEEQIALEALYDASEPAWRRPVPMGLQQETHNILLQQRV